MRYLHPVQAHERFLASGAYRFSRDGEPLSKRESWTMHALGDGSVFLRVDVDARDEENKSMLAEVLLGPDGETIRFDIRYENHCNEEGGVYSLQASYHFSESHLQVGHRVNGAERGYLERELPAGALVDIPLLITRGKTIAALARRNGAPIPLFVPMFEHARLFPGQASVVDSPVECLGPDRIAIGKRVFETLRYRYLDRAASYWIDAHGLIVKRISAFQQREFSVCISDYARSNHIR